MKQIGFIGMGVMGLPMVTNVVKKAEGKVMGFDVSEKRLQQFEEIGGVRVSDVNEIYKNCDVVMQILPTLQTVTDSFKAMYEYGREGSVILDLSSTAPDVIIEWHEKLKERGISLLDTPVSGGNPAAKAGTLAIMAGGDEEVYNEIEPLLAYMGTPKYTGKAGNGSVVKLVNNMYGGAMLVALCEAYAFGAKAGLDLNTIFEATRHGFAGGPLYENKVPMMIRRDYEPGARIAVHRKDILNGKHYAHKLGVDMPMTDVTLHVMDWMLDNGYIDYDQIAMVKYYEAKMGVKVGYDSEEETK